MKARGPSGQLGPLDLSGLQLRDWRSWLAYIKPGDWMTLLAGTVAVAILFPLFWSGAHADRAIIRRDGDLIAEVALTANKRIEVSGPIGTTVIEIAPGRARVLSDPGPRQYCVQQGWLSHANAIAICAPNHVSLILRGRSGTHDSINY
jgi:hypothetical protein